MSLSVCVCLYVCGAVAQLVRECIWRMETSGLQVQVTVMVSYGIISLSKKLTHNYFSRLRSINEYLVIDWGGQDHSLVFSPRAAQQAVPVDDSGQAPCGL